MIFFDIDETLVDQRQAETNAAVAFLQRYSDRIVGPCDLASFCHAWRTLREKHLPAYLRGLVSYQEYHRRRVRDLLADGASLTDRQCDARYGVFLEAYRSAWRLFDDALPCLDAFDGRPLGILSNGNAAQQRLKLERTGILDRFSIVLISEDVGFAKPQRGIFREACRRAGLRTEHCTYLGDQLDTDAQGSRAAGLRGIWLNRNGAAPPPGIEVVHSLAELPSRLNGAATHPCATRG
jgi:putative hydrolase of the HAD superfamily